MAWPFSVPLLSRCCPVVGSLLVLGSGFCTFAPQFVPSNAARCTVRPVGVLRVWPDPTPDTRPTIPCNPHASPPSLPPNQPLLPLVGFSGPSTLRARQNVAAS